MQTRDQYVYEKCEEIIEQRRKNKSKCEERYKSLLDELYELRVDLFYTLASYLNLKNTKLLPEEKPYNYEDKLKIVTQEWQLIRHFYISELKPAGSNLKERDWQELKSESLMKIHAINQKFQELENDLTNIVSFDKKLGDKTIKAQNSKYQTFKKRLLASGEYWDKLDDEEKKIKLLLNFNFKRIYEANNKLTSELEKLLNAVILALINKNVDNQ